MKANDHRWFLGAGVLAAVVASLCCIGPLGMLGLGLGSFAAASWIAEWRPVFLAITFALLGAGSFFALRGRRAACATGACANPSNRSGASLVLLSLATLGAAAFATYPWFAGRPTAVNPPDRGRLPDASGSLPAGTAALRVRIPSMDCEACAVGIAASLGREPGVLNADVTYATKTAVVLFDPDATNAGQILDAIDATGFKAERVRAR